MRWPPCTRPGWPTTRFSRETCSMRGTTTCSTASARPARRKARKPWWAIFARSACCWRRRSGARSAPTAGRSSGRSAPTPGAISAVRPSFARLSSPTGGVGCPGARSPSPRRRCCCWAPVSAPGHAPIHRCSCPRRSPYCRSRSRAASRSIPSASASRI